MFCASCGLELADNDKFCASCGSGAIKNVKKSNHTSVPPQQNRMKDLVLNSTEDVELFLEDCSGKYSESINNALKAQLQIIKFIHNSEMYSSLFDLLMEKLSLSIKLAGGTEGSAIDKGQKEQHCPTSPSSESATKLASR